jgi:hypothetical protein
MKSVASLLTIVLVVLACETPQGQTRPSEARPSTFGIARSSLDAVVPFKIRVPDRVLRDLKERLARTRFPDEIDGSRWDYGNSLAYMIIKLMARLGYSRYGVQGGDHGAPIGRLVALKNARHVAGLHLNLCTAPAPPGDPTLGVPAVELARMREREAFFEPEATGWVAIQQRQPQTLGYALNDSPVGLAAWILHNFRALCGDCDGDVEKKFTKDELLTNITIYWATESITSAMRL